MAIVEQFELKEPKILLARLPKVPKTVFTVFTMAIIFLQ